MRTQSNNNRLASRPTPGRWAPKLGAILATVVLAVSAGCSSSIAQRDQGANHTASIMLGRAGFLPASLQNPAPRLNPDDFANLQVQQQSSSDKQCNIGLSWAQVYQADSFNKLLEDWVTPLLDSCTAPKTTNQKGKTPPKSKAKTGGKLTTNWEVTTATGNLFGERVRIKENTLDASLGLRSAVFYTTLGEKDHKNASFAATALLTKAGKEKIYTTVAHLLSTQKTPLSPSQKAAELALADMTFDQHGNLLVTPPTHLLAATPGQARAGASAKKMKKPADPAAIRIAAGDIKELLSTRGKTVQKQVMAGAKFAGLPQAPIIISDNPTPEEPGYVDCNAVPCVALTFDDGPGPYTNQLLDMLDAAGVKATFFLVGRSVGGHADAVQREYASGHSIGSHSWDHPNLTKLTPAQLDGQLGGTTKAISDITKAPVKLMRPPYGAVNPTVLDRLRAQKQAVILWNIDTLDWKDRNSQVVAQRAVGPAKAGDIILMHDIHPTSVQAVPAIIQGLQAKGLHLVTVPQLLGPGPLEPGRQYFARGQSR